MNEKQSFIIEDLDDFHLVIKADEEWRVRRELEAEVGTDRCHIFTNNTEMFSCSLSFLLAGEEHIHLGLGFERLYTFSLLV